MKYLRAFLFILVFFVFLTHVAWAEDVKKGVTVGPLFQEVVVEEQQDQASFYLKVANTTDTLLTLRLSVIDFGSLDESGGVAFLGAHNDFEQKYGLASWITLEKDAMALGPHEEQTVKVSVVNKESLSPGGHYGAVLFKLENSGNDNKGKENIAFHQAFSSLIFVKKIGGEHAELDFSSIDFRRNVFIVPDSLRVRFQNRGNIHLVPRGTVTIRDPLGRVVQNGILNQESALILPETFRWYAVTLQSLTKAIVPGRYTFLIRYRFDGNEEFQEETASVMLVPPLFLGGVVVVMAAMGYGVVALRRRRRRS